MKIDYARWTKGGFGLAVATFLVGAGIATVGQRLFGPLPQWELTLAVDMMAIAVLVGFVAVFGFGVALPLTE